MDTQASPPSLKQTEIDFSFRTRARREQTSRDLLALRCAISEWLEIKRRADTLRRHQTQLRAIEEVLVGVASVLSAQAAAGAGSEVGKIYDDCRKLAQATVWLERLWQFVCSKFDQRYAAAPADTPVANLLQAADEVIWSCYRQVIRKLPADHPATLRGLMPLAHIEPEYSPAAVQFDQQVPPGLRLRSGSPTLDRCLEKVPLPTLRLPPWCVSAPWGLVLVAHEVGHHVLHELGIVDEFAQQLGLVVAGARLDELSIASWVGWGEEIFADAFSVFAMGSAAAVAITELEWTDNRNLAVRKVHYPAPAIRLALMTLLAQRAGLDTRDLVPLQELQNIVSTNEVTRVDWKALDPVVDFLMAPLPDGLPSLSELCEFNADRFSLDGTIAQWAEGLRGTGSLDVETDTPAARHMASAAMDAWLALLAVPNDDERHVQLAVLASNVPKKICQCAEPVVRAGDRIDVPAEISREIADLLLAAPVSEDEGVDA